MGNKFDDKGTIRSHYVWRYYLEPFTQENGNLFCKDITSGKVFQRLPKKVAFENDIYRTKRAITKMEVDSFLRDGFHSNMSDKSESRLLEGLLSYINNDYFKILGQWQVFSSLKDEFHTDRFERNQEELFTLYENKFCDQYRLLLNRDNSWYNEIALDSRDTFDGYTMARTQMYLKHIFTNALDLVEYIAGKKVQDVEFKEVLVAKVSEIKSNINNYFLETGKDTASLSYEKYYPLFYFINFINSQYFRTRKHYNLMIEKMSLVKLLPNFQEINLTAFPVLFIHYHVPRMGYRYIQKNYKILFLINNSDVPFITSDQPVINTVPEDIIQESEGIEFYYPLSPSLAILYTNLRWDGDREVEAEEAKNWNKLILRKADKLIFSKVDPTQFDICG